MPADPIATPLSDATTAWLQLPGGWFLNNAGWVTGTERTLLVDTCATEARSSALLDAALADTPGSAVSAVLTHAHGDHAHGAGLVAARGGSVLAAAAAAIEVAAGPHTFPEVFECDTWGDIPPPEHLEAVTDTTRLDLGGRTAEIHPVPVRAHTDGDLVVLVPADGVLFTGDLLFAGVTPLALQGSVSGWLRALDWLDGFDAATLVPGHGPVDQARTALRAVRDYLRWLLDVVSATDRPDFDALERQAVHRWPDWHDAERHAVNLRIADAEIRRRDPDLLDALGAMLRSTGGRITLDI